MGDTLNFHHPKARKEHRCHWCGQQILVGERYAKWAWCDYGSVQTCRMHEECCEEQGQGDEEFMPYDNPRPEKRGERSEGR